MNKFTVKKIKLLGLQTELLLSFILTRKKLSVILQITTKQEGAMETPEQNTQWMAWLNQHTDLCLGYRAYDY